VSDEKLWDESATSRHLQVLYHQTSFQDYCMLHFIENISHIVFTSSIYYLASKQWQELYISRYMQEYCEKQL